MMEELKELKREITKSLYYTTSKSDFFEFDNDYFKGNRLEIIRKYIDSETSKGFKNWLIDEGLRVRLLK